MQVDAEKRKEQQRQYGVSFDDDYDYLQHLKDVNELYDVAPTDEPVESFFIRANTAKNDKKVGKYLALWIFVRNLAR